MNRLASLPLLLFIFAAAAMGQAPGPNPIRKSETAEEIRKTLDPDGPRVPFHIVDREAITKHKLTIPANAVVVREDSPHVDPLWYMYVMKRLPSKEVATADSTHEWLRGLKVGDQGEFLVDRFVRARGRYRIESEKIPFKILSNSEAARAQATTTTDRVEDWVDTTANLKNAAVSFYSRKLKSGSCSLILKATLCSPTSRPFGTTSLKFACADAKAEVRVRMKDVHLEFRGGQACEEVTVDVAQAFDLHRLLADWDGKQSLVIRFSGPQIGGDQDVSPVDVARMRDILIAHYADRFEK